VNNCTFSGNSSGTDGSECNCTLAGAILNRGDADANDGIAEVANSIFKSGTPSQRNVVNQGGSFISHGYNITNDAGVLNTFGGPGDFIVPTDEINADPMLNPAGPLNNGGPTQTIALLPGSPAIDSGDPDGPSRDQRYYLRNGLADRGAFEFSGT